MSTDAVIRLGSTSLPYGRCRELLEAYTSVGANPASRHPYAFPAYDLLTTGSGPSELNDGDLLAPAMLNVQIDLRAMYGLQAVRGLLEDALAGIPEDLTLAEARDEEIAKFVDGVYAVLDGDRKPQNVGATKLSKLVHRKRPHLLVLHDTWVRGAYFGTGPAARIAFDPERSWSRYMVELHKAVRDDIVNAAEAWTHLREDVPAATGLSDVRVLDILVWSAGKAG